MFRRRTGETQPDESEQRPHQYRPLPGGYLVVGTALEIWPVCDDEPPRPGTPSVWLDPEVQDRMALEAQEGARNFDLDELDERLREMVARVERCLAERGEMPVGSTDQAQITTPESTLSAQL